MGIKLEEGKKYRFHIQSLVTLPGTNEYNFILAGPDSKKYLLPREYYENYDLKPGMDVDCVVDKINCSGKVFLEPDHPYYKINERYDFLVVSISQKESILRENELVATVRDLHGREWDCPILSDEGIVPGFSHLACRIEKIRKGELMLSLPSMTSRFRQLKTGHQYSFRVKNVKTFDGDEFYILSDEHGNIHRVPLEYYVHYTLRKGQNIKATVVKFASNGECILEPENPYYKVGEIYPFEFLKIEKSIDYLGNQEAVIFLKDHFAETVKVKPLAWQIEKDDYQPESIDCKVDKIKKGRLFLSVVDQ